MKLTLKRETRTDASTIGRLFIDGVFQCVTLEDVERNIKVYGKTAIPTGTYKVVLTPSPRFKRILPLLLDVPGYSGIRIHPGNTAHDTEGCILPGRSYGQDVVYQSRIAFEDLYRRLAASKTPIEIEIV
jgi:hypothetical protein